MPAGRLATQGAAGHPNLRSETLEHKRQVMADPRTSLAGKRRGVVSKRHRSVGRAARTAGVDRSTAWEMYLAASCRNRVPTKARCAPAPLVFAAFFPFAMSRSSTVRSLGAPESLASIRPCNLICRALGLGRRPTRSRLLLYDGPGQCRTSKGKLLLCRFSCGCGSSAMCRICCKRVEMMRQGSVAFSLSGRRRVISHMRCHPQAKCP